MLSYPSRARPFLALFIPVLLTACPDSNAAKPTASITSPASDASVSSTTPIQVTALDETGITKVTVFARARGSTTKGVQVGSAVSKPFVIPWNTTSLPNQAELELYALATNTAGVDGSSDPVRVKTANSGLPSLSYLAAFTYPPQPAATIQSSGAKPSSLASQPLRVSPSSILAPTGVDLETASLQSSSASATRPPARQAPRSTPRP